MAGGRSGNPQMLLHRLAVTLTIALCAARAGAQTTQAETPTIGMVLLDITDEVKKAWRVEHVPVPPAGGLLVGKIDSSGPASRAGLRQAEVLYLTSKTGPITTAREAREWESRLDAGQPVTASVLHREKDNRGTTLWKRRSIEIVPVTSAQLEADILRVSYLKIDGKWLKLPTMDLTFSSSTLWRTSRPEQATKEPGSVVGDDCNWIKQEHPEMLITIAVGEYGKVRDGTVDRILSPMDAVFRFRFIDIRGADEYKHARQEAGEMRLLCRPSEGLADGQSVSLELGVAVVGTCRDPLGTIFIAVPLDRIKKGLSDAELVDLKAWLKAGPAAPEKPAKTKS